jgi:type IV pilus assembly protein PilA
VLIICARFAPKPSTLAASVNQPAFSSARRPLAAFTLVEIMVVVVVIGLLASLAMPAFQKIRQASQDKAVLNNARQLAAAADQYMMETGRSSVPFASIVGPTTYVKAFETVAGETYPTGYTQGMPLTITGVAGQRTITYGF